MAPFGTNGALITGRAVAFGTSTTAAFLSTGSIHAPTYSREPRMNCPDYLTHYFEQTRGPFKTLSDLSAVEAERVQRELWQDVRLFASKRDETYLETRRQLERLVRQRFIERGGHPARESPFTMVLGSCSWFHSWYVNTREIRILLREFDPDGISFTYGDMFPAMRFKDGKAHRGTVALGEELDGLVESYGLPQERNADGKLGPDRYIEAQVWSNEPIEAYVRRYEQRR